MWSFSLPSGSIEERPQGNELGLTARTIHPVIIGDDEGIAVPQYGKPFHFLDHQTVVGCKVGNQVADKGLAQYRKHPALWLWGVAADRKRVDLLDGSVWTSLIVPLYHSERVGVHGDNLGKSNPPAIR